MTGTLKNRVGRPSTDPADIEHRRITYRRYKDRLGMTAAEVAALTGLSKETCRNYPGTDKRPNFAPTEATLSIMFAEILRRSRAHVEAARAEYQVAIEMEAIVTAAERRLGIGQRRAA